MTERLIAFIPALNEARRIADVIQRTRPFTTEVVVIDDGSRDDTGAVSIAAGAKVLRHEHNRGKGAATVTALEYFATSDATHAIFLDADGQHAPEDIPEFIRSARASGAMLVVGNRMVHMRDMPFVRRCTNRLTSWLIGRMAHQIIPDSQCGFRLLDRRVLPLLRPTCDRFEIETEMLLQIGRAGHPIGSATIQTIYDPTRHSRIRPLPDTVRFFRLLWKYRR